MSGYLSFKTQPLLYHQMVEKTKTLVTFLAFCRLAFQDFFHRLSYHYSLVRITQNAHVTACHRWLLRLGQLRTMAKSREFALTFHFELKLESSLTSVTNFGFQLYLQALIPSHESSLCDHPHAVRHRECVFNLSVGYINMPRGPKIREFR